MFEGIGELIARMSNLGLGILAVIIILILAASITMNVLIIKRINKNKQRIDQLVKTENVSRLNERELRAENNKLHTDIVTIKGENEDLICKNDALNKYIEELKAKRESDISGAIAEYKKKNKVLRQKLKTAKADNATYSSLCVNEYEKWTVNALIDKLKSLGVGVGVAQMKKAELVDLLINTIAETK